MNATSHLRNFISALAAVAVAGWVSGCCLAAHPYHVSRAEVNWNQKSGNFEVALCLWPADLEKAISNAQNKPIDLDKVENLDALLKAYIEKKFLVRPASISNDAHDKSKLAPSIRWVGHEKTIKEAWLYFEVAGNAKPEQWTIESRVFFELNEDQMNQVELTVDGTINSFICCQQAARHSFFTTPTAGGRK